jgi:hypothetical protein
LTNSLLIGKQASDITGNTPAAQWPAIKKGEESGALTNLDASGINIYRGPVMGVPGNSPFDQYLALMNQRRGWIPLRARHATYCADVF